MSGGADAVYTEPFLYDLAFGYRDFAAEIDFLRMAHAKHGEGRTRALLDLAAGPGRHAIAGCRAGLSVIALDKEPSMAAYATDLAKREGVDYRYHVADITDFAIDKPSDIACLLLGSMAHLLKQRQVLDLFDCVADAVRPGGVFVLELPHPSELFGRADLSLGAWEAPGPNGELLLVEWGRPGDRFDALSQITWYTVGLVLRDGATEPVWTRREFVVPQRRFTLPELQALMAINGRFGLVGAYGALDLDVPIHDDEDGEAHRMVLVLKRLPDAPKEAAS
jgi:SAM-dependent methyltransferase